MSDKPTIFISYSHLDEDPWKDYVVGQLGVAARQGYFEPWDDRRLRGGDDWRNEIEAALKSCKLAILLISHNFLTSDFIMKEEVRQLLDRHSREGLTIYPILVRACDWKAVPWLEAMNLRPLDGRAMKAIPETEQDEVMVEISQEIREILASKEEDEQASSNAEKPIFNLEHQTARNFVERPELQNKLSELIKTEGAAALVGLGGSGKTQIATDYAYRHRDAYSVVWWLNAGEPSTLARDYANLAEKLKLPVKGLEDQKTVIDAVRRWLKEHDDWLLIFDNASDPALIKSYLPPDRRGHTIITALSQAWSGIAGKVDVSGMKEEEAVDLLLRDGGTADAERAGELAEELGHLPLALAQAKAYMEEAGSDISGYLDRFRKYRSDLLKRGRVLDYPVSVAATWEMSFEAAGTECRGAADLMNIGAFLAPDAIPKALFPIDGDDVPEPLSELCRDGLAFDDSIAALRRYSLIETGSDTLSFHRLVQAVARDRLSEPEHDHWASITINLVNAALPDDGDDARHWPIYQRLLPHALSVTKEAEDNELAPESTSRVLDHIGNYLRARANFADAERHLNRARDIREKTFGKDHPDIAETLNNLGWLHSDQGRLREAEPLIRDALAIREKALGAEHPHTAMSFNNLGYLYLAQGKFPKAEPLFQRALATHEKALDAKHSDTAMSLNNLAGLYQAQGQYPKAEPFYQRALAIREKVLGAEHPNTAQSLSNLAELYRKQGHYPKAEPLYQRALAIREKALGDDHPDTALSLNNLAGLYEARGRYPKAEPLFQRALAIREKVLGTEHPHTAQSLNNLAGLYQAQGQYPKAEPLYQRALAIPEKALGDNHPNTAASLNNLAGLYQAQGQYPKAEPLYERALAIYENALGAEHPDSAQSLKNLGALYINMNRKDDAETYFQRALDIYDSLLKADPDNLVFQERHKATQIGLERAQNREPVQRDPKVGRNAPCPCGSGKKFKHCHGKADA